MSSTGSKLRKPAREEPHVDRLSLWKRFIETAGDEQGDLPDIPFPECLGLPSFSPGWPWATGDTNSIFRAGRDGPDCSFI